MTNVIKITFIVAEIYNTKIFFKYTISHSVSILSKNPFNSEFNTEMEQKSLAVYVRNGFHFLYLCHFDNWNIEFLCVKIYRGFH